MMKVVRKQENKQIYYFHKVFLDYIAHYRSDHPDFC